MTERLEHGRLDTEALYAALDQARKERGLSWRGVAAATGVSPSTLTRMAQGKRPDVDGFAALTRWLGVPAETFFVGGVTTQAEPVTQIVAYLRAGKQLSPKSAEALEAIVRAAYERFKDLG